MTTTPAQPQSLTSIQTWCLPETCSVLRGSGIWTSQSARLSGCRARVYGLKLRADFINMFNHANLYADPVTNIFSPGGAVLAHRGATQLLPRVVRKERRNIQVTAMFTF